MGASEKKDTEVLEKKLFKRRYQGDSKPRGTGGIDIEQNKFEGATLELKRRKQIKHTKRSSKSI